MKQKMKIKKFLWIWIALVALVCVFASCAGSSGGSSNSPSTPSDNTNPSNPESDVRYEITIVNEAGDPVDLFMLYVQSGNRVRVPALQNGRTFLGFYTSDGVCFFDENGRQTEGLLVNDDLILYQKWENAECFIYFDSGKGTLSRAEDLLWKLKYGTAVHSLPVPEYEGYDFLGWKNTKGTLISDGQGNPTAAASEIGAAYDINVANIAMLTAEYDVKKCTVTFDYNDSELGSDEVEVIYGETLTDLPTRDYGNGFMLFGWSENPYARSNEAITTFGPITEDITIYAVFSQYKYINLVYTETNTKRVMLVQDVNSFVFPKGEEALEENPGYNCTGWYKDPNFAGSSKVERTYFIDTADTFYATWEQATYRLTLKDENGSSFENGAQDMDFTISSPAIALPTFPERDEYEFLGWATEDQSKIFPSEIPQGTYGSITLSPLWRAYTTNFILFVDSDEFEEQEVRYNRTFSLPVPTLPNGDVFAYWYYYDGDEIVPLTDDKGASSEVWKEKGGSLNVFCKYLVTNVITITYEDPKTGETVTYEKTATEGKRVSISKPTALASYLVRGYYVGKVLQTEEETYLFIMPDHAITVEIVYTPPIASFTINGLDVYKYNGHCYAVINKSLTWENAKTYCEFYGGHLVTISDENENEFVKSVSKKSFPDSTGFWIGLTDKEQEGTWKWVTGETFTFKDWGSGQPDNSGDEDYALYWKNISYLWNDGGASTGCYFVCEWENESKAAIEIKKLTDADENEIKLEVMKYNGHYYAGVTTPMNWVPAERYAEALGGHLVTISDDAENTFVNTLRKNAGLGNAFIGWTDFFEEGKWEWVTGETANYTKWTSGNPDNYNDEDFGQYYTDGGEWNDIHGTSDYKYCFIIEWERASDIGVKKSLYVDGVIRTASDLKRLARSFPTSVFTIESDINMGGLEWTLCDFAGTLDGKGHTISGFTFETDEVNCGFIKTLTGTIKNLSFRDLTLTSTVTNKSSSCSLINTLQNGTVENVKILSGTIRAGVAETGGVVSFMSGTSVVRGCENRASILCENDNTSYDNAGTTGGIIAWISGGTPTVEDCANYGEIMGTYEVGGLIGGSAVAVTIKNSSNHGTVSGKYYVGGLIGSVRSSATIDDGFADFSLVTALGNYGKYAGGPKSTTYTNFQTRSIENVEQMNYLLNAVNGESFELAADIDMTDASWQLTAFAGTLDGKGHVISGLTDSLFRTVSGTIKDLIISTNITKDVEDASYVGGVAAEAATGAVLSGVEVRGTIAPLNAKNTGGLIGVINSSQKVTVENCVNSAAVTMNRSDMSIGGIVGYIYGSCTITFEGNVNSGAVSNDSYNVGGMIGAIQSNIMFKNCVNNGDLSGANCIGGIVGYANGATATIDNCKTFGEIRGTNWKKYVGGGSASYVNFEPTAISKVEELKYLLNAVAQETFELAQDIDMADFAWTPCAFAGTLDGKGHAIKNLTLASETGDLALFSSLSGTVKDLEFVNASVTSTSYTKVKVAVLAANSTGNVSGVIVRGSVTGDLCDAAGLIAYATAGTVEDCVNYATISGTTSTTDGGAGGVIELVNGASVVNCANYGVVGGKKLTAGVVADMRSGTISGAKNYGLVTGGGDYTAGVIASFSAGNIPNLLNEGAITGAGNYTAGVIGCISYGGDLTFTSEYVNKGAVTGKNYTGGIVGYLKDYRSVGYNSCSNTVTISKWTNEGAVAGANYVGGLIGQTAVWADHAGSYSSVIKILATNLKNQANVTGTSHVGGLIGYGSSNNSDSKISDSASSGTITAEYVVGGLFGQLSNIQIADCSNEGASIVATGYQVDGSTYHAYVGGYTGIGYTLTNCNNAANITYTDRGDRVGGIAGSLTSGAINNCSNTGNITATKANYVGGIVGYVNCGWSYTLNALTNSGDISGASCVGGIFGYVLDYRSMGYNSCDHTFAINKATNSGKISAAGSYAGGIIGYSQYYAEHSGSYTTVIKLTATNLTNTGDISAATSYAGGLFGYAYSNNSNSVVKDSSSSGAITAEYIVGGIAGTLDNIKLTDSSNEGTTVTATGYQVDGSNYNAYLGGYCGYGYYVENCENRSDITYTERGRFVGGILGYQANGGVASCKNYGDITALNAAYVGGIYGYGSYGWDVSFTDLENSGAIKGKERVGGVFGEIRDYRSMGYNSCSHTVTMTRLTNSGAIEGGSFVGGVVGRIWVAADHSGSYTTVIKIMAQNPTNTGAITGSGDYIGGVFGYAYSNNSASRILAPSATGAVTGTGEGTHVGQLNGLIENITVEE